ncbi:response regulator [Rhodohalobacter sp. SW132]|uniref:response regulator n=1 Tax=Rhodohalobacter sp. SW132 TaxID=2293433 RepID=UPI000E241727|nr:response regulator [Rhodohalobacter sp. SW132]REL29126.1 response regulator [Rhodohalobacter sp. SW132]
MDPVHILLVEDNEGDIFLIREAFEEARVINTITTVKDGEKAIDYLERKNEYADVTEPDLILLDVNLPRKNGHEVLAHIKNSEDLKHIPVVMLTTSSAEQDIVMSYKNHANCYITKPVEVDDFLNTITKIEKFWIQLVKLPSRR